MHLDFTGAANLYFDKSPYQLKAKVACITEYCKTKFCSIEDRQQIIVCVAGQYMLCLHGQVPHVVHQEPHIVTEGAHSWIYRYPV